MDDHASVTFDQDLLDRYGDALGTLFPDERIQLVDKTKKDLGESAASAAEQLELQKEVPTH
jgi:RecA/RadA recombinase